MITDIDSEWTPKGASPLGPCPTHPKGEHNDKGDNDGSSAVGWLGVEEPSLGKWVYVLHGGGKAESANLTMPRDTGEPWSHFRTCAQ